MSIFLVKTISLEEKALVVAIAHLVITSPSTFGLLAHFLLLLFSSRAPYPLTEPCNPMATSVQTLPLSRGPNKNFRNPFPAPPLSLHCGMGSVGSLVERPDVSPTKTNRAVPQVRPKQTNSLLKKGFTQRELLNYLNITR